MFTKDDFKKYTNNEIIELPEMIKMHYKSGWYSGFEGDIFVKFIWHDAFGYQDYSKSGSTYCSFTPGTKVTMPDGTVIKYDDYAESFIRKILNWVDANIIKKYETTDEYEFEDI